MNIPVIFQFLKELSANNNREWFNRQQRLADHWMRKAMHRF